MSASTNNQTKAHVKGAKRRKPGRMRPRLHYADVMATIAIFAALGGGVAVAATAKKDSVTSKSIRDGQVRAVDLGPDAVTGAVVEDGSIGGADIDPTKLRFDCNVPVGKTVFRAQAGGPCFFVIRTAGSTWQEAIAECAAERAQLPTVAEVAAIVPIGPSPANTITTWTSDIVTPTGVGPAVSAWTVSSSGGTLNVIGQTSMKRNLITDVLCTYNPANTPL